MKLKTKIKGVPDTEFVYLGSKGNAGWMFIGTCAELKTGLARLNDMYLKKAKASVVRYDGKIAELKGAIEEKASIAKIKLRQGDHIRTPEEVLETTTRLRKRVSKDIESWVDLADREVVEEYKHISRPQGTCLLIAGSLKGCYWTYNEVLQDQKKKR